MAGDCARHPATGGRSDAPFFPFRGRGSHGRASLDRRVVYRGTVSCRALVHHDVIPGDRQDWLVRPIRRRDLLAAKLASVVLVLQGPTFANDLLAGFVNGLSFSTSLSTALGRSAWMFAALSLPWLACSSIFSNPVAMVGLSLILVVLGPLIVLSPRLLNSGMEWIPDAGLVALVFVASASVLALTYLSRRVMTARLLLAAAVLLPFGMARLP